MKVCFVLDRLNIGGAEAHALDLADMLEAQGHEARILVLKKGGAPNHPAVRPDHQIEKFEAGSVLFSDVVLSLGWSLRSSRTELVFAVNQTALVAAMMARWLGLHEAKIICLFHTTVISSLAGQVKLPLFKHFVRQSDGIVYVSRKQFDYWRQRGIKAPLETAIPNGINTKLYHPPSSAERRRARAEWGFSETDIVLLLCARFAPEKNHAQLVEALGRLVPQNDRYRLLLVGDGATRAEIEKQVQAAGLSDKVVFTGARKDVPSIVHAADAGVLVSNAVETFSLAALEVMAAGLPMVLSDIGGASEMVRHGETGMLFPVDDTDRLVEALQVVADADLRRAMGLAAQSVVVRQFSSQVMLDRYLELLASLAEPEEGTALSGYGT